MPASRSCHVARALLSAIVLLLGAACRDADHPLAPPPPPATIAPALARRVSAAPGLLDAIADAESRIVPALGADVQAPMRTALAELRAALGAGARARRDDALGTLRALVAEPAAVPDGAGPAGSPAEGAADRAAIAILIDVAAADTNVVDVVDPPVTATTSRAAAEHDERSDAQRVDDGGVRRPQCAPPTASRSGTPSSRSEIPRARAFCSNS